MALRRTAGEPARDPLVFAWTGLIVVVLFAVSGGLLWTLGLNYDGVSGSAVTKIHPATYLAFGLAGFLAFARYNPASFAIALAARQPATLVFAALATLQAILIAVQGRPNLATAFDTYLLAGLVAVAYAELDEAGRRRIEMALHVLMAANAAMALLEFAIGMRFLPYRFEGQVFELDARSAALHGHPLVNATVTGCYLLALLGGGGPSLPTALRFPATLLQLAALVAFGGRTALALVLLAIACQGAMRILAFTRGARVPLGVVAGVCLAAPLAALALGGLALGGFFDAFLARFGDDGGSAEARVGMFDLFASIPFRDLLVGPSAEFVDSIRRVEGLEWGIENPIVRALLYQGVVVTLLIGIGFALFMAELKGRLGRGAWPAFLFFLVVIMSFESIASKTTLLAKFVVLMLAMFPAPTVHQAFKPRALRRGLSSTRAASSV